MMGAEFRGYRMTRVMCDGPGVNAFSAQVNAWLAHREWTVYRLAQEVVRAVKARDGKAPMARTLENSIRRWAKDEHAPGQRSQDRVLLGLGLTPQEFWAGPPATRSDATGVELIRDVLAEDPVTADGTGQQPATTSQPDATGRRSSRGRRRPA